MRQTWEREDFELLSDLDRSAAGTIGGARRPHSRRPYLDARRRSGLDPGFGRRLEHPVRAAAAAVRLVGLSAARRGRPGCRAPRGIGIRQAKTARQIRPPTEASQIDPTSANSFLRLRFRSDVIVHAPSLVRTARCRAQGRVAVTAFTKGAFSAGEGPPAPGVSGRAVGVVPRGPMRMFSPWRCIPAATSPRIRSRRYAVSPRRRWRSRRSRRHPA